VIKKSSQKIIDEIINWRLDFDILMDKLSYLDKSSKPFESALSKIGDEVHIANFTYMANLEKSLNIVHVKFAEAFESTSKKELLKDVRKLKEKVDLGTFKNSERYSVHLVLSKEQIIKKVMQLDDPSLASHFKGMHYTDEIKHALRNVLSEKELAWAEKIREMYKYMWKRIDPVFMKMTGLHFDKIPNYSGIARTESDLKDDDTQMQVLLVRDLFRRANVLKPSLKMRTQSKAPLKYDGATSSLINYILQMEHYIAWAETINDLNSIFQDRRIVALIRRQYGSDVLKRINGFIKDIARDGVEKAKVITPPGFN